MKNTGRHRQERQAVVSQLFPSVELSVREQNIE